MVCERIEAAYRVFLGGMEEYRRTRRAIDGLLGFGGSGVRCQDDFVSELKSAVEEYTVSSPDSSDAYDTLLFMISRANEYNKHNKKDEAYWMLLATHALALPLVELIKPADAGSLSELFEEIYPKRERFPVQKEMLKALKRHAKRQENTSELLK